jgi:hypothetical protein
MTPHCEMQWHALLGLSDPSELQGSCEPDTVIGSKWAGHDPPIGAMDIQTLDALCRIFVSYTEDPSSCYFGLCTIQGWLEAFSADELKPLLSLPWERDHVVVASPLSGVDQIFRKPAAVQMSFVSKQDDDVVSIPSPADLKWREAPNLIWPANRTWLVASEVDFDSTLVGGSAELIEAIIKSPDLEAWQVQPTDSLAADADKINLPK